MKNTITIDGVIIELTEEQVEKLKVELGVKKKSPFERVEDGRLYFCIDWNGCIYLHNEELSQFDVGRFNAANYCTDKGLMTKRAKEEVLNRLLWRFSMENDGDKIDWEKDEQFKYFIYFNKYEDRHKVGFADRIKSVANIYFYSEEIAQRAIDEIIIPFNEGKLPCCEIWKE